MFPITVGQNFVNKSEHIPYICSPGGSLCDVELTLLEIPLVSSFVGSKQLLTFPFDFTSLDANINIDNCNIIRDSSKLSLCSFSFFFEFVITITKLDRCNPLGLCFKIHDASRYTFIRVAVSRIEIIGPKQLLRFPFDFTLPDTNIGIDNRNRRNPLDLYCKVHNVGKYTWIHVAASQLEIISPLLSNEASQENLEANSSRILIHVAASQTEMISPSLSNKETRVLKQVRMEHYISIFYNIGKSSIQRQKCRHELRNFDRRYFDIDFEINFISDNDRCNLPCYKSFQSTNIILRRDKIFSISFCRDITQKKSGLIPSVKSTKFRHAVLDRDNLDEFQAVEIRILKRKIVVKKEHEEFVVIKVISFEKEVEEGEEGGEGGGGGGGEGGGAASSDKTLATRIRKFPFDRYKSLTPQQPIDGYGNDADYND
ncbi:hypothetical protein V1478_004628 [Vespula squamosa]|uniref:Uncharacterized protein n=1 Tax=Vespula squamosa TaxID=30214 RepID=A0ABD2BH21_VESSQ